MSAGEVDVEDYRRLSEDIASAIALREPLGAGQLAALALTLAAVALATRG